MEIGFRNLHVIAKDLIEADFERADTGTFALTVFHSSDDLFGVLAEVAQFVELGVKAGTNDAGIGSESGRLVGEGAFEAVADVGKFVNFVEEETEKGAAASGRRREEIAQDRKLCEGLAQG